MPADPVLTLRLPRPELDHLTAEAERRGMTRSELIRQAIASSTGAPASTPEAEQ